MQTCGIAGQLVTETPLAIFDVETTGLIPGSDRIVEISIIRREPGGQGKVVFDSLINPGRRMGATDIHGISDEDVADAPTFQDVGPEIVRAISDCVLASYNVCFDMPFLNHELERFGIQAQLPHFCLMYMRPMLGLGKRCSLQVACEAHNVTLECSHQAAGDAMAAAQLMEFYSEEMQERGIETFRDLGRLKKYKFVASFDQEPIRAQGGVGGTSSAKPKSRVFPAGFQELTTGAPCSSSAEQAPGHGLSVYWESLKAAVCDLEITDDELLSLQQTERELGLQSEEVRALHARLYASVLTQFANDQWLDERERRKVRRLHECLSQLGWAPGE